MSVVSGHIPVTKLKSNTGTSEVSGHVPGKCPDTYELLAEVRQALEL